MEHSSPLAAMQPPAPLIFGRCFRSEAAGSYSRVQPARKLGPESFNFKELSMSRFHADYFSAKPVGSSPTASLAADLSQNFHIDQRYVTRLHRMLVIFAFVQYYTLAESTFAHSPTNQHRLWQSSTGDTQKITVFSQPLWSREWSR
jgi:M-phase inducer tyrosine phosphatase